MATTDKAPITLSSDRLDMDLFRLLLTRYVVVTEQRDGKVIYELNSIEHHMQVIEIVVSVITALGGWEMIKYCMNRKTNRRKEEAEADNVEFNVLREAMDFLQTQLKDKEQRFAEQTDLVRKQNLDILQLNKEKAQLELDLQRYKCVIKGCIKRDPQNGY